MFLLRADKNKLAVIERQAVTSGSVNVYTVRFEFSPDWGGLTTKAVFRGSGTTKTVLLDENGQCVIPREVLASHGQSLMAGVFGTKEGTVVPSIWENLGKVLEGVPTDGPGTYPPTPELWEQELAKKGDRLGYTEVGELGLYAGEKLLSSVPAEGGGSGAADHRALSHRDEAGQHPISAIDGLPEALERIPEPVEPLTNSDLEEILK